MTSYKLYSLLVLIVAVSMVQSISIVRHIPYEEETMTNAVFRKAYSLIPSLKKLRASSPAVGKDFVSAVVTGLSSETIGTGLDSHGIFKKLKGLALLTTLGSVLTSD